MNMPAEVTSISSTSLIMQSEAFDRMMNLAETMSAATVMVPKHLHGKAADCAAIVMQALQWGMNPYVVAQKTHVVNGTLGYEAQLVNAVLQSSGAIDGRPHYEYRGDGEQLECRVGCLVSGESEIQWNEWLKFSDVTTRNSPLWKTNKKQQFGYLQLKNWARLYCPGSILGVYTPDELETVDPKEIDITPKAETPAKPEARPSYPDEAFNKNFDKWRMAIETGKSTHDDWLRTINAKGEVTDGQLARIYEVKAPIQGEVIPNANS